MQTDNNETEPFKRSSGCRWSDANVGARMPGFEEALLGRILGEAVKPIVGTTKQALARRGMLRSDVYTAINRLVTEHNPVPSTLGSLFALPIGFTQRNV